MRWMVIATLLLCAQVGEATEWSWKRTRARFEVVGRTLSIQRRYEKRLSARLKSPFAWPGLSLSYDREQFIKRGSLNGVAQNNILLSVSLPFFRVGPAKSQLRSELMLVKVRGKLLRARRQLWLAKRLVAYRYHNESGQQLQQLLGHLQRFKEIVDRRQRKGVASTYEVNAASIELAKVQSQAALHSVKRHLLVAELTASLGLRTLPKFRRLRLPIPGLARLQSDCLEHDPTIQLLKGLVHTTRARKGVTESKRLPVFNLRGGYTFLEHQRVQHGYLVGVSISFPLFDMRRRELSQHRATLDRVTGQLRSHRELTLRRIAAWHRQLGQLTGTTTQPALDTRIETQMTLAIQAFEKAGDARRFLDTARAVYELRQVVLERRYLIDRSRLTLYELVGKNYIE